MVSFWVPSGPFTGGRFPRRPWIPWSGTLRIAVPCLLGTELVSFGYRCVFWVPPWHWGGAFRVPSRRMGGVIRVRIGVIQVPIRTFGGYLMAVSLPSDAVECGHIDGFETFCVFWVPARVFWVPAGVFLGVVWVFVGGYVVGDFVDLHLTDDEMARFHDSARIVREHCAMIADRL